MNKAELVESIATTLGTSKKASEDALKGRNPQTGEEVKIPASKTAVFKAGKGLKDSLK